MLELVIEVLGEIFLQVLIEILAEVGLRSFVEPFQKPPNPWYAAVGYAAFGALAGVLSLLVFPGLLVKPRSLQIANLILTPIIAGYVMMLIGAWRQKRDQYLVRLDRFAYGCLFAFAMALMRFVFAR